MMLTQSLPSFRPFPPRFGNTLPPQDERLAQKKAWLTLELNDAAMHIASTQEPPALAYYIRPKNPGLSLAEKQEMVQRIGAGMTESQRSLEAQTDLTPGLTQTFHLFDENV